MIVRLHINKIIYLKTLIIVGILSSFFLNCGGRNLRIDQKPLPEIIHQLKIFYNIGEKLPDKILRKGTKDVIYASSSNLIPLYSIVVKNINYHYGVSDDGIISYIEVADPNFNPNEGFSIDTTLKEIQSKIRIKMVCEDGWAYYIPLKNGWHAAFFLGETATDREPTNNDKISFFFKRK